MRRRNAFTLVELLVTIALVTFIMALLSEAFIIGLKTFRDLKAIGDMDERLRAALMQMQTDLQADHFEGKRRLGDPNFWASGPPREGFFQIYAPSVSAPYYPLAMNTYLGGPIRPTSYFEGVDGDGIPSAVVTDSILHFSVKLRGNRPDRFFSAIIGDPASPLLSQPTTFVEAQGLAPDSRYQVSGGKSYNGQWAEVAYFLWPPPPSFGIPAVDFAGATPLYTLYRTQMVVAPDTTRLNSPAIPISTFPLDPILGYEEMSCLQQGLSGVITFLNPSDLAGLYYSPNNLANVPPQRAFDPTVPQFPDPFTNLPRAATFVMGNVISFEVQALAYDPTNPAMPQMQYVNFDTGSQTSGPQQNGPPTNMTIRAVQITLRVWDMKTQQSRQITIVQDL